LFESTIEAVVEEYAANGDVLVEKFEKVAPPITPAFCESANIPTSSVELAPVSVAVPTVVHVESFAEE
jgi:hypothetical protein